MAKGNHNVVHFNQPRAFYFNAKLLPGGGITKTKPRKRIATTGDWEEWHLEIPKTVKLSQSSNVVVSLTPIREKPNEGGQRTIVHFNVLQILDETITLGCRFEFGDDPPSVGDQLFSVILIEASK